jgi:spoIIIJ-associated protein
MEQQPLPQKIKKIVGFLGLRNCIVEDDESSRRVNITTDEDEWFTAALPDLVKEFKYLISVIARKEGQEGYTVDINNYRKEREKIIVELAKAAAQKAVTTKQEVHLPAMNAYERRLIHVELSIRPDVKTESTGEGKERGVVIKPL